MNKAVYKILWKEVWLIEYSELFFRYYAGCNEHVNLFFSEIISFFGIVSWVEPNKINKLKRNLLRRSTLQNFIKTNVFSD